MYWYSMQLQGNTYFKAKRKFHFIALAKFKREQSCQKPRYPFCFCKTNRIADVESVYGMSDEETLILLSEDVVTKKKKNNIKKKVQGDHSAIELDESGQGEQNLGNEICHSLLKPVSQSKCKLTMILKGDTNGKMDDEMKPKRNHGKRIEFADCAQGCELLLKAILKCQEKKVKL